MLMTRMDEDIQSQEEEYALIRRIVGGDRELFRTLVLRHQDLVYGMVMRQVGDRAVAEDLSQEVFLRAYRALGQFKNESRFSTWVARITLNQVASYFASANFRQKRQTVEFRVEEHDQTLDAQGAVQGDLQGVFHRALAALSPKLRDVLVLCGLEGMSYEDAASFLKIPVGTVRSRLNAARLGMRSAYKNLLQEVHDEE